MLAHAIEAVKGLPGDLDIVGFRILCRQRSDDAIDV
jgi:hypothetical protein